jgi:hypothetical protein
VCLTFTQLSIARNSPCILAMFLFCPLPLASPYLVAQPFFYSRQPPSIEPMPRR